MSAQAGIWYFDQRPVDPGFLSRMLDSIACQGPDDGGHYVSGSVGIVFAAFHTTKESGFEKQPYISPRGHVMTWDGRLDNREELIKRLPRYVTSESTDLAIAAAAFDEWECDCFAKFIGDWAFSIWVPRNRELIFAVDYVAVRHIFYYPTKHFISWATDLGSLVLLSGNKFHINDDYVAGYFANYPDASLTPYSEILEVPPGQFVRVRAGTCSVERYWRFNGQSRVHYSTDREYEEHFRFVFRQSLRRRLRSNSPILAELSGGLDSSAIVCMADDIILKEMPNIGLLDTLSYYDRTEPNGDDWIYIQKLEESRRRTGVHIDISTLGDSSISLKSPDFVPLPGYLGTWRSLEAKRAAIVQNGGFRAVLSGIGGDEFLGGVPNPNAHLADLIVQFKVIELAKQLMSWSLAKRRPWIHLLWNAALILLPISIRQHLVEQAKTEPWIDKQFARRTRMCVRQLDVGEHFGLWLPTRRAYIGGLVLMANKLSKHLPPALQLEEKRYPYLDQNLIEFILSIPANQLLRPGDRRSLMRRSLMGIVPQEVLSRKTKQLGQRTPIVTVEKNWEELQTTFNSSLISNLGYIDQRRFIEELHEARAGKKIHIARMQKTISLEFWLSDLVARSLLDNETLPSPHRQDSSEALVAPISSLEITRESEGENMTTTA